MLAFIHLLQKCVHPIKRVGVVALVIDVRNVWEVSMEGSHKRLDDLCFKSG
jgi:hypothetical protein